MSLGTPQKARDLEVFTSALLKPSLGIGGPTLILRVVSYVKF